MNSNFVIAPRISSNQESPALFEQRTIVELSDAEMTDVNGGTTPLCAVAATVAIFWSGMQVGKMLATK